MSAPINGRHHEPEVHGYCVHCRTRRPMQGSIQVCNRRGGRDLKGLCAVCGKSMYRLGGWDAVVAAAQKTGPTDPEAPKKSPGIVETD